MTDASKPPAIAGEPIADRPKMSEMYLQPAVLPWSWAEARLTRARNYWVSTVTASGRPYSRPVWAVWLDARLYFSTGPSGIRHNLERAPAISVNLESGDQCVILEGTAELEADVALLGRVTSAYLVKYGWAMQPTPGEWYTVHPRVVFAWISDGSGEDRGVTFTGTATRFRVTHLSGH